MKYAKKIMIMQQTSKHTSTTKIKGRATEASVSGCYNSPPLTEDLVPRSRTTPERNERGRGKTKLLLRQMSETKEP